MLYWEMVTVLELTTSTSARSWQRSQQKPASATRQPTTSRSPKASSATSVVVVSGAPPRALSSGHVTDEGARDSAAVALEATEARLPTIVAPRLSAGTSPDLVPA